MALLDRNAIVSAMNRLVERTEAGTQIWAEYDDGIDEYVTETKKFAYFVSSRDGDGTAPFKVEILRKLDGKDPLEVGDYRTTQSNGNSALSMANRALSKLYAAAKASAFGVSGLEEDLLHDLE